MNPFFSVVCMTHIQYMLSVMKADRRSVSTGGAFEGAWRQHLQLADPDTHTPTEGTTLTLDTAVSGPTLGSRHSIVSSAVDLQLCH